MKKNNLYQEIFVDKYFKPDYLSGKDIISFLDKTIGSENWQCDYKTIKGVLYAGIGIKISEQWIWKWSSTDHFYERGLESTNAFRNAAYKWGIGKHNFPFQYFKEKNDIQLLKEKPLPELKNNIYEDFSEKQISFTSNEAISEVRKCKNRQELLKIKDKYKGLESFSKMYKKVLTDRYEILF